MRTIVLKPGKEKPLLNKHYWIFSGALADGQAFDDGEILAVYSSKDKFLGSGYFNHQAGIIGRMLTFDETPPLEAVRQQLESAIHYRAQLFADSKTTAYRLVNGEGDGLPGLIVDRYADLLVMQIGTLGMEKLKSFIVDELQKRLLPRSIYEKSLLPTRKAEGLKPQAGLLLGEPIEPVEVIENGLKFVIDVAEGQKTGFFCDHREMRSKIGSLSPGKRVLNCFSYSGGFSVYALAGGASHVESVDLSASAIEQAKVNVSINGFALQPHSFHVMDVFEFLRAQNLNYDIVILDPPAFAKKQKDVVAACRGYKDINRVAMQKMPRGSWLLTCSCSHHVAEPLFQKVLFQAAVEAGRKVRIAGRHIMAADHPVSICHPESEYLKSFLLYIE